MKSNVMEVYELLGGTHGMYAWARENPGAFYLGIYSKLLPRNVDATIHVKSLEDLVVASSTETDLVVDGGNVIAIESRSTDPNK